MLAVPHTFIIKGISPITHKLVELTIEADTAMDAKRRAEQAGFETVTVRAVPKPPLDELKS
jgi:hypothetical protein